MGCGATKHAHGVQALINLLDNGSQKGKSEAAAAIATVCEGQPDNFAYIDSSAVKALVKLVRDGSDLGKENACSALQIIVSPTANPLPEVRQGAISVVCSPDAFDLLLGCALNGGPPHAGQGPNTQARATKVLANVGADVVSDKLTQQLGCVSAGVASPLSLLKCLAVMLHHQQRGFGEFRHAQAATVIATGWRNPFVQPLKATAANTSSPPMLVGMALSVLTLLNHEHPFLGEQKAMDALFSLLKLPGVEREVYSLVCNAINCFLASDKKIPSSLNEEQRASCLLDSLKKQAGDPHPSYKNMEDTIVGILLLCSSEKGPRVVFGNWGGVELLVKILVGSYAEFEKIQVELKGSSSARPGKDSLHMTMAYTAGALGMVCLDVQKNCEKLTSEGGFKALLQLLESVEVFIDMSGVERMLLKNVAETVGIVCRVYLCGVADDDGQSRKALELLVTGLKTVVNTQASNQDNNQRQSPTHSFGSLAVVLMSAIFDMCLLSADLQQVAREAGLAQVLEVVLQRGTNREKDTAARAMSVILKPREPVAMADEDEG